MNAILIDSCVLLDLFTNDQRWADWSEEILEQYSYTHTLYINSIIYAEMSIGFTKIEDIEYALAFLGIKVLDVPREALFFASQVFLTYKKNHDRQTLSLFDFCVGAHASISNFPLITRESKKYQTYFPTVQLIYPQFY